LLPLTECRNPSAPDQKQTGTSWPNLAYQWAEIALEATARDTQRNRPRPTVTSRYLALIFTSMFDAWSRYDATAIPVYLHGINRRPENERTLTKKEEAISYAAYFALCEFYPDDSLLFRDHLTQYYSSGLTGTTDTAGAAFIGMMSAKHTIEARWNHDGSNAYAEEPGSHGIDYFNYLNYQPVNPPDSLIDPIRWQPKYFVTDSGTKWAPECLTPHWQKVIPIALPSADVYRPGPPPTYASTQLRNEVRQVIELQTNLTNEQKALVEFMRDGPRSVQQAGHWLKFAMNVSARDKHNLDDDIKMFFAVEVAAMDAFIACWDAKMYYDYARPYSLVHTMFGDSTITGWGGEGKGWISMKGKDWRPYSPSSFLCPPFPSYPSGHSTVSGACSEILRLFTGSDTFGEKVVLQPGSLTETNVSADSVTLEMPTFSATADMAGFSRVLGGYHIQSDNLVGLELGRKVGNYTWQFCLTHINGPG
ncbi:MAG: vanadium-dependent haloperoxidase, partial [Flavobacteriales bacterium]|nr:vanadium-dependent haloperoxidase [Flavobacteriales bacterium]